MMPAFSACSYASSMSLFCAARLLVIGGHRATFALAQRVARAAPAARLLVCLRLLPAAPGEWFLWRCEAAPPGGVRSAVSTTTRWLSGLLFDPECAALPPGYVPSAHSCRSACHLDRPQSRAPPGRAH